MRFSLLSSAVLAFSSFAAAHVTPSLDLFEVDVAERDLGSFVSSVLDGDLVSGVLSSIDVEKIAGWADDLLNEDDNIKYLDNILGSLAKTNLLPNLVAGLLTNDAALAILKKTLPTLLEAVDKVNTTTFFVALDRSGLVYSIVASTVTNDELLPALVLISKKLIADVDLNITNILAAAGDFISDKLTTRDVALDSLPEEALEFDKRDNVEDLLTTVLSSVERSGLLNDTIVDLLLNDELQDGAVVLIQGLFENLGSVISDTDFSALAPIASSLWKSGLLQNTFKRALENFDFKDALEIDLGNLLNKGTISLSDLVGDAKAQSILATSSVSATVSATSSKTKSASASASSTADSGASRVGASMSLLAGLVMLI